MPHEKLPRPRQQATSCNLCRTRKLRCDRTQPCLNCKSRGVQCDYQTSLAQSIAPAVRPIQTTVAGLRLENDEIRARLHTLENIVLAGQPKPVDRAVLNEISPDATPPETSAPESSTVHDADSRWLESVWSHGSSALPHMLDEISVKVVPTAVILEGLHSGAPRGKTIMLPVKSETLMFFESYVEHVDSLQHILHIETVRRHVDALFESIQALRPLNIAHLGLLLSIIASALPQFLCGMATAEHHGAGASQPLKTYWTRCSFDTLDHAVHTASPSLETVLTNIILLFAVYHSEGFTPKLHHLQAAAITAAKDIGLHLTDAHTARLEAQTQEQTIVREIRRRVWWHLASTDW